MVVSDEEPDTVIQIDLPPRRIDVLTDVTGLAFEVAWDARVVHQIDALEVPFIGREDPGTQQARDGALQRPWRHRGTRRGSARSGLTERTCTCPQHSAHVRVDRAPVGASRRACLAVDEWAR